jgi:hypothetical protein
MVLSPRNTQRVLNKTLFTLNLNLAVKSVFIEVTRKEEVNWNTLRVRRKIILNEIERNQVSGCGKDSNALGKGQVVGFSKQNNELSDTIKGR